MSPIVVPPPIIVSSFQETEVADRIVRLPNTPDTIERIVKILQKEQGYPSAYYDQQAQMFRHKYTVSWRNQLETVAVIMVTGIIFAVLFVIFPIWNLAFWSLAIAAFISGFQLLNVGDEETEDIDLISEVTIKDTSIYLSISSDYSTIYQISLLDDLTKEFGIDKQDTASWPCQYCHSLNHMTDLKCLTCGASRKL